MLNGIVIKPLRKIYDERGSFTEIMRRDWKDTFPEEIAQTNMSTSYPGMIRAWHKHEKGQIDCFAVLRGGLKICAYDDESKELNEIISNGDSPQLVRVPGNYWHGFMVIGNEPSILVYFVNRLYDYKKPDEIRRPWDDQTIIPHILNGKKDDPRCGVPWNWLSAPYR
jgi:dTDP-4-dehydrorhamnose 3,5-epimerase